MGLFEKLDIRYPEQPTIDWEITPAYTFTFFESWGSQRRVRSIDERYYYFFIDNWETPAKLFLMERGIKYARVLAEIKAPQMMIDACIAHQGEKSGIDKAYAIDDELRTWLTRHILDAENDDLIIPVDSGIVVEELATGLPSKEDPLPEVNKISLNSQPQELREEEIPSIILKHDFFDSKYNPEGAFQNTLVDNGDGFTVTDLATGLMWQRGGLDISSIRGMQTAISKLNQKGFAGFSDWRLPTIEEALSILEPKANAKGIYLHPCFSQEQPFVFLAAQRLPGGYWFADFKQGNIFWASGFNPGGFGRLCRSATASPENTSPK